MAEQGGQAVRKSAYPEFESLARESLARWRFEPLPRGQERILFIDDEGLLAEMGEELLTELGYQVVSKTGSREALAVFRLDPLAFDLVVTDQTMPYLSGLDLAKEMLSLRPDLPIILCTGFTYTVDVKSAGSAGIRALLMKPLTRKELAHIVRKVLDESGRPVSIKPGE